MAERGGGGPLVFNGLDATTGDYLIKPMTPEELRDRVAGVKREDVWAEGALDALETKAGAEFPLPPGTSPSNLEQMGWGVIFPALAEAQQVEDILEAMDALISHRKAKAQGRFRIYRGAEERSGGYRPGDSGDTFVTRLGGQPGSPDFDVLPYYLLIVADPQSIPFSFQYDLDVQYAVGRIYFETLDEFACYARSVVRCETDPQVGLSRQATFFGVANENDPATNLSATKLVDPLYDYAHANLAGEGWQATKIEPANATKTQLTELLGGDHTPALLFTATHGLGWPYGHEGQYRFQGALVCQDWPGPIGHRGEFARDWYFGGEDIAGDADLLGMILFSFACFGAGTPYWDDYAVASKSDRRALAHRAFLSDLPRKLLAQPPGGALAVIGHVERAWSYSFDWMDAAAEAEPRTFQYVLHELMLGSTVGYAMDHMNVRYAELAGLLAYDLAELKFNPRYDARKTTLHWIGTHDARGFAVIGDPAVKLPVAPKGASAGARPEIEAAHPMTGRLPQVMVLDSIALGEEDALEAEIPHYSSPAESGEQESEVTGSLTSETPRQKFLDQDVLGRPTPAVAAAPYASAMDGLAFALQAYASDETVSFGIRAEGVSFDVWGDAKEAVRQVVDNLNKALHNLSQRLLEATNDALMLEVTTSLVNDLDNFDPTKENVEKPKVRFKTTISATGDIQVFLPARSREIDVVVAQVHKDMVEQTMNNRIEMIQAVGEVVASLFSPHK